MEKYKSSMKKLIYCFLFFIAVLNVQAKLDVKLVKDIVVKDSVHYQNYPYCWVNLQVLYNGSPTQIGADDIMIFESNRASKPDSIIYLPELNCQKVYWRSKLRESSNKESIIFLINYKDEYVRASDIIYDPNISQVRFFNNKDVVLEDYHTSVAKIGDSTFDRIKVELVVNKSDAQGLALPIRLDSIKNHNSVFRWRWRGMFEDNPTLPTKLISPFTYNLFLYYKPDKQIFYKDKLTLYFQDGLQEDLNLFGNTFPIEKKTILNVVYPNGGEVLAPCQNIQIKWVGYIKGISTEVEFSNDNGVTWNSIGSSMDSVLNWTVPKDYTGLGKIRVYQNLGNEQRQQINIVNDYVDHIKINHSVSKIAGFGIDGKILEWDLLNNNQLYRSRQIIDWNDSYDYASSAGINYINDSTIIAAYKIIDVNGSASSDTIIAYDLGKSETKFKFGLDTNFITKDVQINVSRTMFALIPKEGKEIRIYSTQDGSLLFAIPANGFISSFSFNHMKDSAVISLYDGTIKLYDLKNRKYYFDYQLTNKPYVENIQYSDDGKFLALGCKAPDWSVNNSDDNEINLFDIETNDIVRTLSVTASEPLGLEFSPTSKFLVIGQGNPQIVFWDLPTDKSTQQVSEYSDKLKDFYFAEDGHTIAALSANEQYIILDRFNYPEIDASDSTFSIVSQSLVLAKVSIEPKYIGTENKIACKAVLCNNGQVPLDINDIHFMYGVHYKMDGNLSSNYVYPGQCLDVNIIFNPQDTGRLIDTLLVTSCGDIYEIAFSGISLNRNLILTANPYILEDQCVNVPNIITIPVFKNADPVPVTINYVEFKSNNNVFQVVSSIKDTVIQPGEILSVQIQYTPAVMGANIGTMYIYHSNQKNVVVTDAFQVKGIGTELKASTYDLRFVPEILERSFTVTNVLDNPMVLEGVTIDPPGNFSVETNFPITVVPKDSTEIKVIWNGNISTTDAVLSILASPCLSKGDITLGQYTGQSILQLMDETTYATKAATIKISMDNYEAKPYNGIRFLDAEFTMLPKLFIPQGDKPVVSKFGTATLTKNEVVDGKRHIGIRIEGNFNTTNGIVAEINGVPGLAEESESPMDFVPGEKPWGANVITKTKSGTFKILCPCGDTSKFIIKEKSVAIKNIVPNPVNGKFNLDFWTANSGNCEISVYDNAGITLYSKYKLNAMYGDNVVNLDGDMLPNGSYRIIVKINDGFDTQTIMVVR